MKKKLLTLLTCAALMTLAVSLFACGKKEEHNKPDETVEDGQQEEQEDPDDTSSKNSENEPAADGKYASVEEYLNSDIMQTELNSTLDSLQGSGMKMDIKAEGNQLIYSYQYTDLTDTTGMAESLETAMDSQAGTFQSNANALKAIIDAEDLSILIEYLDANGTLIYSREFSAE